MMLLNKAILSLLLTLAFKSGWGQSIGQLTITPANPTPADTIYVITSVTYSGNCAYGLAYTYSSTTGNTITLMPTYCGYGATTTCTSIDTLKLAPLGIGNYIINVEFHQGSICPISNFDAMLGAADTSIVVSHVATALPLQQRPTDLKIYPNPVQGTVMVEVPGISAGIQGLLLVSNLLGQRVLQKKIQGPKELLDVSGLPAGIYVAEVETLGKTIAMQRLVVR